MMKILNLAPSNLCNISTNLSYGINEFSLILVGVLR